ncbi:hypothetical protein HB770_21035 [Rhizobium leguminosarum bv. viciae]|uniref:Helix-turn-helix domain-containing protein n=1 Tax=Rhizobium leguminosarum bv. viciae TaxID=387 RepID=A0A7G6RL57_RHILV|nr:hypothetical protein HB770_21035 [Rhizobium leguminosarum bv. viciae]
MDADVKFKETDGLADAQENFYHMRMEWLDFVVSHPSVSHGDFRVAYFIARKINADDQKMWWRVSKIAKGLGVSTATVSAATMNLEHLHLMTIGRPSRGINSYAIRMPFDLTAIKKPLRKPSARKAIKKPRT